MAKKRRIFEPGHGRKLMVIVDESPEVEGALFYAAGRVMHAGGFVVLLYVIEPENQFWEGVRQVQLEEETNKAKAIFRLFRRKLNNDGYESVPTEEVIREGKKVDEILKQIDEDEDIAVLVLGASKEAAGPGPLVSTLAVGANLVVFSFINALWLRPPTIADPDRVVVIGRDFSIPDP